MRQAGAGDAPGGKAQAVRPPGKDQKRAKDAAGGTQRQFGMPESQVALPISRSARTTSAAR
jgi:hypothetical protein